MSFESSSLIGLLWLSWAAAPFGIAYWAHKLGRSSFGWGLSTLFLGLTVNAFFFLVGPSLLSPRMSDFGVLFWSVFQAILPFVIMSVALSTSGPTPEKSLQNIKLRKELDAKVASKNKLDIEVESKKVSIENAAYTQALDELRDGNVDKPTMAKAIIDAGGDQERAQSIYLSKRVAVLIDYEVQLIAKATEEAQEKEKGNPLYEEIVDASGARRNARRLDNGIIEVETKFGESKKFASLEEARKYFRG